jgi:predicted RNA-binding Zn-ribbon protein involved in translation (DUF1610 family)
VRINDDGGVDAPATNTLRSETETARRAAINTAATESGSACPACGKHDGVARSRHPMHRAGPWIARRYDGDGPNFELLETNCGSCGGLVDVSEVLKKTASA